MRNLTLLAPFPPYPALSGGQAHILAMAQQLARFFQVDCFALSPHPELLTWGPLVQYCRSLAGFQPVPSSPLSLDPPMARAVCSPALVAHLTQHWRQFPPQIVQLEYTDMLRYVQLAKASGAQVVCTAHNVAFLAQIRRARREVHPGRRLRRWLGAMSLWRFELRQLRQCDLVITLGPADQEVLQRWLPGLRVDFVSSGIDLEQWPYHADQKLADQVLFVGNYYHPPNVEGVEWLVSHVWPLVLRQRPQARLILAGRDPPPPIQRMAGPQIVVPGTVDDLRPLYRQASMAVAPIFWGAGVRIKLLEALAAGLPIVTTAMAAEGMDLHDCALYAEQPASFAAAMLQLMDDADLRLRLGQAARRRAEQIYDWNRIGERLAGLYDTLGR